MFTANWRHVLVLCLLSAVPIAASAHCASKECGRLLSGLANRHTIYVVCPGLPEMNAEQALSVIIAVLDGTTRISGDTRIFFFRDESVLRRDRQPADQGRLIESWGKAFVGAYHTHTGLLTVRSAADDKWREIHLPTTGE